MITSKDKVLSFDNRLMNKKTQKMNLNKSGNININNIISQMKNNPQFLNLLSSNILFDKGKKYLRLDPNLSTKLKSDFLKNKISNMKVSNDQYFEFMKFLKKMSQSMIGNQMKDPKSFTEVKGSFPDARDPFSYKKGISKRSPKIYSNKIDFESNIPFNQLNGNS